MRIYTEFKRALSYLYPPMISRNTIDLIYQAAIIEDVVGEFVALKKSGKSYKGLSPFSSERNSTNEFVAVLIKIIITMIPRGLSSIFLVFTLTHIWIFAWDLIRAFCYK